MLSWFLGLCCHPQITVSCSTAFILKVAHALNSVSHVKKANYSGNMILQTLCGSYNCFFFYPQACFSPFLSADHKAEKQLIFEVEQVHFQKQIQKRINLNKSTRRHNCLWVSKAALSCLMKQTNHKSLLIGQCGRCWFTTAGTRKPRFPLVRKIHKKIKLWNVNADSGAASTHSVMKWLSGL